MITEENNKEDQSKKQENNVSIYDPKNTKIKVNPCSIIGKLHYLATQEVGFLSKRLFRNGKIGNTAIDSSKDLKNALSYISTSENQIEFLYVRTGSGLFSITRLLGKGKANGIFSRYLESFTGMEIALDQIVVGEVVVGRYTYFVCPYIWEKANGNPPAIHNNLKAIASSEGIKLPAPEAKDNEKDNAKDNTKDNTTDKNKSSGSSRVNRNTLQVASQDPTITLSEKFKSLSIINENQIDLEKIFLEKISEIEESNKNK